MAKKQTTVALRGKMTHDGDAVSYGVFICPAGHLHLDLRQKDTSANFRFDTSSDAYEFAHAILRGYDMIEGIDVRKG